MRRLFIGLVVTATTVLLPVMAMASNQETAEQIAGNLRQGNQLQDYKIGVKFQNGTAWLNGSVASEAQLAKALEIVSNTEGVNRVVNQLKVGPASTSQEKSTLQLRTPENSLAPEQVSAPAGPSQQRDSGMLSRAARRLQQVVDRQLNPTKENPPVQQAERVASSYVPRPAQQTSAMSVIPQEAMQPMPQQAMVRSNRPVPVAYLNGQPTPMQGAPMPAYSAPMGSGVAPVRYDQPCMPNYAWPSYASHPNYAALTYPTQYSPTAWPYIGPFYPYPQVPLGWRKVTLEWDDGWWMLDFKDSTCH